MESCILRDKCISSWTDFTSVLIKGCWEVFSGAFQQMQQWHKLTSTENQEKATIRRKFSPLSLWDRGGIQKRGKDSEEEGLGEMLARDKGAQEV